MCWFDGVYACVYTRVNFGEPQRSFTCCSSLARTKKTVSLITTVLMDRNFRVSDCINGRSEFHTSSHTRVNRAVSAPARFATSLLALSEISVPRYDFLLHLRPRFYLEFIKLRKRKNILNSRKSVES